ncbi:MAG: hypothetical protein HYU99_11500 [Deltaproteobacteria bacterium]|nr:hypothetical protein [Deltaproteobacteria bacterium]
MKHARPILTVLVSFVSVLPILRAEAFTVTPLEEETRITGTIEATLASSTSPDPAASETCSMGLLDAGFGEGDGIVTVENVVARDLAVSGDYIYVAGYTEPSTSTSDDQDFFLARFLSSDGSLDTSFSGDGIVTTDFSGKDDQARAIGIAADGTIYVAGYANSSNTSYDMALWVVNSSGNEVAATTVDFGGYSDIASDLAIDATTGDVYLAGQAGAGLLSYGIGLVKFNSAGAKQGDAETIEYNGSWEWATGIAIDESGAIYLSGATTNPDNSTQDIFVMKYDSGGSHSFGVYAVATTSEWAQDMALTSSGKIAVTGYSSTTGSTKLITARFASATLTADAGSTTTFDVDYAYGWAVAADANENIISAGSIKTAIDADSTMALARYDSDFALDSTFSSDGKVTQTTGGSSSAAYAVGVDTTDGIYAAGTSDDDMFLAKFYGACCGDSNQDGGEECDDGNTTDGDGCSASCTEEEETAVTEETDCDDGTDDDSDGSTDCDDSDCATNAACTGGEAETDCTDSTDNDEDGATDCDDSDCSADSACAESGSAAVEEEEVEKGGSALAGGGCGCTFGASKNGGPAGLDALFFTVIFMAVAVLLRIRLRRVHSHF